VKEYFLRAAWLYLGFYLCDIHFGHYMAMETNNTTWTVSALMLVVMQCLFFIGQKNKLMQKVFLVKW